VKWQVNISFGSWIHPQDATRAVVARFRQSLKDRKRISEERIWQDLFLASLGKPPWSKEQIEQIEKLSSDKNFRERFARALDEGRSPTFDSFDILILSNCREIHLLPEIQAKIEEQEGKLPGLVDWSPKAVIAFLEWAGIKVPSKKNPEEWFVRRRHRLGLPGKYPHKIKNFIVINDSVRIVR
jgi:hypothetical protein